MGMNNQQKIKCGHCGDLGYRAEMYYTVEGYLCSVCNYILKNPVIKETKHK